MLEKFIANPVIMDTIYSFDYFTESWIEVSSQPSSSSLSSAATDDNRLRFQHDYNYRRRRRLNPHFRSPYDLQVRPTSAAGSSQEEYEESESESDRIMTSSNEGLDPQLSDGISLQCQPRPHLSQCLLEIMTTTMTTRTLPRSVCSRQSPCSPRSRMHSLILTRCRHNARSVCRGPGILLSESKSTV